MKTFFFVLMGFAVIGFLGCKEEDDELIYEYHAHIHQPTTATRTLGDTLEIEVEFESHTGETIHHINVRIFNKTSMTEVYSKPDEPHVHDSSGDHIFEDEFVLSVANGVSEGDWVLEAKVWGHEDAVEEVTEQVEFHVNP